MSKRASLGPEELSTNVSLIAHLQSYELKMVDLSYYVWEWFALQPKFTDISSRLEAFPNEKLCPHLSYRTCHRRGKKAEAEP